MLQSVKKNSLNDYFLAKHTPDKGPAPLHVTFTCKAIAEVHTGTEYHLGASASGSPVIEYPDATITQKPENNTYYKPDTYTKTAKAEYGGVTGENSVTFVVEEHKCMHLFKAMQQAKKEWQNAQKKLQEKNKELNKLNAQKKKYIDEKSDLKEKQTALEDERRPYISYPFPPDIQDMTREERRKKVDELTVKIMRLHKKIRNVERNRWDTTKKIMEIEKLISELEKNVQDKKEKFENAQKRYYNCIEP